MLLFYCFFAQLLLNLFLLHFFCIITSFFSFVFNSFSKVTFRFHSVFFVFLQYSFSILFCCFFSWSEKCRLRELITCEKRGRKTNNKRLEFWNCFWFETCEEKECQKAKNKRKLLTTIFFVISRKNIPKSSEAKVKKRKGSLEGSKKLKDWKECKKQKLFSFKSSQYSFVFLCPQICVLVLMKNRGKYQNPEA